MKIGHDLHQNDSGSDPNKLPQDSKTCLSARLFARLWMRLLRRQVGSQHNVLEATLRAGLDPRPGFAAVKY